MAQIPPASSPPNVPPPIPSPAAPGANGRDEKLDTGEFAALQVQAKDEDKERSKKAPASHWDVVKSTVAIIGTLAGIVLGFVAFGDRIVARAEGKTTELVQVQKDTLIKHVIDSAQVHAEIKDALHEFRVELKEQRSDMKALYRAIPSRRMQSRLELDVVEPDELEIRGMGVQLPTTVKRDGGR